MKCFVTVVLLASFAFVSAFLSSSVLPRRTALRMKGPEKRMEELGIKLPPPPKAAASYVPSNACGNMLYLSGHLPIKNDGTLITGRIGEGGRDVKCGQEGKSSSKGFGTSCSAPVPTTYQHAEPTGIVATLALCLQQLRARLV